MKQIVLGCSLLLMTTIATAQFYVRGNVGYNMPMNSDRIGRDYSYSQESDEIIQTYKGVYGSYGAGMSFSLAAGGSISNGIFGYDVEVGYLASKKYTATSTINHTEGGITETSYWGRSFQITPSFTFTSGTGKFQPFARMGPVIAITTLYEKINSSAFHFDNRSAIEYEYSGGISVGFKGAMGATYSITPKTQMYVEIDVVSLSYAPTKREITRAEFNGQDVLNSYPEKVIDLEKEYSVRSDESADPEPEIRETHSMGSIGLQIGVKFILNKG